MRETGLLSRLGVAIALLTLVGLPSPASAAPATTDAAPAAGDLVRDSALAIGDVVRRMGLGVMVPPAGSASTAVALRTDGSVVALTVSVAVDGAVSVRESDSAVNRLDAAADRSVAPPPACSDPAYEFQYENQAHWVRPYEWRFQISSTPAYLDREKVRTALKRAASTITTSRSDCGLPDQVNATQVFKGTSAGGADFTEDGVCNNPAGSLRNAVDFGVVVGVDILARSCLWASTVDPHLWAASTRLDIKDPWYVGPDCVDDEAFSVQAVQTAMFGFNFGLGSLNESDHGNLTMGGPIYPCDSSKSTLGLGDVLGLRALYPGTAGDGA